ncbi:MAG: hypothetical protein JWR26_4755 [Pedosphaera sp.]|nr:hypothetical protein [Pedosphaera sp.]
MSRWRPVLILILVAAGIGTYFILNSPPKTAKTGDAIPDAIVSTPNPAPAVEQLKPVPETQSPATNEPATVASPAVPTPSASAATVSTEAQPDGLPPVTVLENMRTTFRNYGSMFHGNPVGTNLEITRALNGDNPKQAKFINPEAGLRINGNGELVDPWGTPYFFHQLSALEMEIRSAGPDKVMWTADDLVTR